MGNVLPQHGPRFGRNSYIFYGLGMLIVSFGLANTVASHIADLAFFLNILVQTSSVMIGFTSLVAVFLIQASIQREREAASDYLHLFVEVNKVELSGRPLTGGRETSAQGDLLRQLKYFMGSLELAAEGERKLRRATIYVILVSILTFTASLFTSIIVGIGSWDLIWLPFGLVVFGISFYPILTFVFVVYPYPMESRSEFSLKVQ